MNFMAIITTLQTAFGELETIDPSGANYKKLCMILDRADDDALRYVYAADIKIVSKLAFNRMLTRKLI